MPREMGFDYMGMSFQEKKAQEGVSTTVIFGFSLLFVFLILAALYESWSLPFSVLLSTPVAIFGAFAVLWLRRFVLGWKTLGHETRLRAYIVNYADDLVICCRSSADKAAAVMRSLMEKLKLTVNEAKTRACRAPAEKFDFLGYTFGRCFSPKTGRVLYRHGTFEEADTTGLRGNQRGDRTE